MARGKSGRIVLEVGVNLKNAIHDRLSDEGVTLKDWFIEKADFGTLIWPLSIL